MKLSIIIGCIGFIVGTSNIAYADIHQFQACVFDKTTGQPVNGASIRVWSPGGSVCSASTGPKGCTTGCGLGYPPGSGGFIEAVANIRKHQYRQQYLLPTNLDVNFTSLSYRYDFYLDTLPIPTN